MNDAITACNNIEISQETRDRVFMKEEGLKKILDINLNIALKPEQWTRILEQVRKSKIRIFDFKFIKFLDCSCRPHSRSLASSKGKIDS